jgi:hypothetical protein
MNKIPVLVDQSSEPQSGTLGILTPSTTIKESDASTICESLAHLSEQPSSLLQGLKKVEGSRLTQVQLQVGVTAEGGIALIGLAKAGVSGAITLTFSV